MIKRNSVWIVFLLMLFSIGSITTNRTEAKSKNEFFYKKEGKTITITKYNGNKKNIVVPDKIKGKKVAAISVGAFSKAKKATKVTLPKYLKQIDSTDGDLSMWNIRKKKLLVTTPFSGCDALKNIQIKKGNKNFVSIKGVVYSKDRRYLHIYPAGKKQTKYSIAKKTRVIEVGAFENTVNLKNIIFNNVQTIGHGAFRASGIKKLALKKYNTVGKNAFAFCDKLETVSIGEKNGYFCGSFIGCKNLRKITVDKRNKVLYSVDGILYEQSGDKKYLLCYPAARKGESFTIPADVIAGGYCFSFVKNLKEVAYESKGGLSNAFYQCKDLKITIPDKILDPSKSEGLEDTDAYDDSEWNPFLDCENLVLRGKNNAWAKEYVKTHEGVTYEEIDVMEDKFNDED